MRLLLLFLMAASTVLAAGSVPDLDRVFAEMKAQQARIQSWEARMKVDINLPGMKVKGKRLQLFFTAPDSFRFTSKGFAILPRRTMLWTADSLFKGLSEARLDLVADSMEHSPLRVRGLFREGGLFARMEYRVDTTRWLVTRVRTQVITQTDTLEALDLRNSFLEMAPGLWLPETVLVEMTLKEELQEFYERLRTPLRRRKKARDGMGRIAMTLDRHKLAVMQQDSKDE